MSIIYLQDPLHYGPRPPALLPPPPPPICHFSLLTDQRTIEEVELKLWPGCYNINLPAKLTIGVVFPTWSFDKL